MNKGFFESLFDLSFTSFVTIKLVKILFILSLAGIGLAYLFFTISAFATDTGFGVLVLLIIGPLFVFSYTLLYRVLFELIIVLFRIFENTRDQLALQQALHPEAAAAVSQGEAGNPATPSAQ